MKYRLDDKHYADDKLLEPGTEVGDGCEVPWRYAAENKVLGIKAGQAMPPSVSMTPIDDEAKKIYTTHFGGVLPERDPTKAIPIMGFADAPKAPGIAALRPGETRK